MSFLRIFLGTGAILLLFSGLASPLQAAAQKGTGLPLPRFVSLRAGEVNLRTGPGVQHPVDWVYHRQNLPLEIIAEYGTWRKIRDWQGTQGWVHQSMVSAKRTFIVIGGTRTVRRKDAPNSDPVARAETADWSSPTRFVSSQEKPSRPKCPW